MAMPVPTTPYPTDHFRQTGFTMVELVIVIVIMGILAGVAAPRFFERNAFDERGYYEDTLAALRFAQKLAVATGCQIQFTTTASDYTVKKGTACVRGTFTGAAFTSNVFNPGNPGNTYTKTAPAGLTLSATTLKFNGLGQASGSPTITLTGTTGTRSITVVAETGFVY
jgi:MSHA pilin protein MshC